ncbi:26s proteasome non-atpase regulatory subunit 9 [Mycena sanguinolenta]|uniref:26s proteasome non-atpase regulatory subunit 9 n=1 Tax=Mycena sanguinolenta TaxID=230812 RepID=A0A8H7CQE5_9AGAR|nr:26s proteasome non-atpase regulatory subunit 9 [Mycena sanguinolenta]
MAMLRRLWVQHQVRPTRTHLRLTTNELDTMASPAETAKALMLQKENIEAQLQLQAGILAVNNGSTMDSPLIDSEGFPRADIDIYAVRNARVRIIELRNDLHATMNALSLALQSVYDPALAPPDPPQPESKPFAKVDGVSPGSPAAEAGLQRDDLVVKFGALTQRSFSSSSLKPLVDVVAEHENRSIPLKVLRSGQNVFFESDAQGMGRSGASWVSYRALFSCVRASG